MAVAAQGGAQASPRGRLHLPEQAGEVAGLASLVASSMASAVTGPIPGSAVSVPLPTLSARSAADRSLTTSAARRNARTRYVGAPARSS